MLFLEKRRIVLSFFLSAFVKMLSLTKIIRMIEKKQTRADIESTPRNSFGLKFYQSELKTVHLRLGYEEDVKNEDVRIVQY
jgi:hypothetical protein